MDTTTAFEEGYKAYQDYQNLSDNPYFLNVGVCDKHWLWENGFFEARSDLMVLREL
jgi:hypothetical protein